MGAKTGAHDLPNVIPVLVTGTGTGAVPRPVPGTRPGMTGVAGNDGQKKSLGRELTDAIFTAHAARPGHDVSGG